MAKARETIEWLPTGRMPRGKPKYNDGWMDYSKI